ncbi:AraC family transcriptional regulator [Flagellimonas sp. 389]|uniref:helix-turn-helix domain-containing protein n=1 Tax=Flagellimonas sp. 389 TaxID=2835862 RepID=UPI001BD4F208|nr:helix-turn-helix domain-containing protein [Flagellimonas sp. 389]MBS9464262.1 AraC family transcriptional regulator [Flagellimonas sp. 389]
MELSNTLLFFFSALGAFNGLVLSMYFIWFAKPKRIATKFLGFLLLMMSVRIGKSVVFYFKPDLAFIYLQLGLSACFFIGPFLFFYTKSVIEVNSHIAKTWKYHILILLPLIGIVGYLYPFKTNIDLWRPYIIYSIYTQWFIYIVASGWVLRNTLKTVINNPSKASSFEIWVLSVFGGNIIICSAYYFTSFTHYLAGALTFSFLFYLLSLLLFLNRKKNTVFFIQPQKYVDKKIEASQAENLFERLDTLMAENELYKNANLKSSDVAQKLQISVHQLSQLLNDNAGKSFPLFINEYRIEKALQMLTESEHLTLESIGYECGFNSKSTFYTSFKKIMGTTPAKYKAQLQG